METSGFSCAYDDLAESVEDEDEVVAMVLSRNVPVAAAAALASSVMLVSRDICSDCFLYHDQWCCRQADSSRITNSCDCSTSTEILTSSGDGCVFCFRLVTGSSRPGAGLPWRSTLAQGPAD